MGRGGFPNLEQRMAASSTACDGQFVRRAVANYERPLIRYAARLLGDVERARDVVQETFLRLCCQKPADLEGHLAEWLFTVCRNRALDVQRKERRMTQVTDVQIADRPAGEPGPLERLERQDSAAKVVELLQTLPFNQQEVIRLKFQNGLSYREISNVTNLTVSNVGFLIHTAIKTLRQKLADLEAAPAQS
jgi:RNA polymerase sigma-70 factor (ECF subfamily)